MKFNQILTQARMGKITHGKNMSLQDIKTYAFLW